MPKKEEAPKVESKELETKQSNELANANAASLFAEDKGAGFENTGMDDYVVPFLMILQKLSPQCDEDNVQARVEGARAGMFYNTATGELYESIRVVPCAYERMFSEWVPRDKGGGFRGHHLPESIEVAKVQSNRDERGRFVTDRGTHLMDTRYHFVLLLEDNHRISRAVVAMSSTQIKKSRLWMTAMRKIEMIGPNGKAFTPPMFSHIYKLTTVAESNDQGNWRGYKVDIERPLSNEEIDVYMAAKAFRKEIESGRVKVDDSQLDRGSEASMNTDEVPF